MRLRVRRDHDTSATQFTAVPCVEPRSSGSIWLRYRAEQRDHVRAMYASIDDAILAGADAKGKIIAGDFWAHDGDPKERPLTGRHCASASRG